MKRIAVVALAFALVMGVHASSGPASGVVTQQWTSRYNGPGNGTDYAKAVAVDGSGNVYVTGTSPSATSDDCVTVKYNSAGVQQWASRFNVMDWTDQCWDLALDSSGNVYVTGTVQSTVGGWNYETVKYNSAGVEQWSSFYDGLGNATDMAHAVAVDGSGNVYVTGESYGGAIPNYDYATVKYNSAGVQQWASRYDGPANTADYAYDLALDSSGNVYVTGPSWGAGSSADYATVKYDSAGTQKWASRYNGPGNAADMAYAVAVDGSGNVYVTGESDGGVGWDYDYATVKYNSAGTQQWASRYDGPARVADFARALSVDGSGNVYVTGYSYGGATTGNDYATVKYNSAGTQQWASRYDGPAKGEDRALALALGGSGNVYVTGRSYGGGSTGDDYATLKYDSAGTEQWAIRYNGSANGADQAAALAVDASGNVYVTGKSYGGGLIGDDYATVKYSQAGAAGVGGIQALPDVAESAGSGSSSSLLYVAIAGAGAAAALAGAGWYARRRWRAG